MERVINLTPHVVNIVDENGNLILAIDPTSPAARVSSQSVPRGTRGGVPFVETVFGNVENLPDPQEDTYYIVSQLVIAACPDRIDLVRPDTGPTCLRTPDGKIVAVRSLTR